MRAACGSDVERIIAAATRCLATKLGWFALFSGSLWASLLQAQPDVTDPSAASAANEDSRFFDYLGRIDRDSEERPKSQIVALPDSLDEYARELFAARTPELDKLVRWLVLKNIPPAYEDNRKWGLEKEVYDGFRFRREGLKLETERKYRTVKHGTWSRYFLELVDPEHRLVLRIDRLEPIDGDRLLLEITIETPLHAFGRISRWQRNIQFISLSMNADVAVRLWTRAEIGIRANPLVFPPEVQFEPKVVDAKLELTSFEVHRVSQVGGPIAEELGKGLRKLVDEQLDEYSDRLVSKMNQQLAKQREKLKFSPGKEVEAMIEHWTSPASAAIVPR